MDHHAQPVFDLIDAERDRFARRLTDLPCSVERQTTQFRRRREALGAGIDGTPAGTIRWRPGIAERRGVAVGSHVWPTCVDIRRTVRKPP